VKEPECGGIKGVLIAEPEIFERNYVEENWDYLFMGCDGIFDIFDTEKLIAFTWQKSIQFKQLKWKNKDQYYRSILNSILSNTMT
jgi:serine/threonine protein phosphatase PrpC